MIKSRKVLVVVGLLLFMFFTISTNSPFENYAQAASKKQFTLKAVTFLPTKSPKVQLFKKYFDKVNEVSEGELVIKLLGGPEVIGSFELAESTRQGVTDISVVPASLYQGLVPEAFLLWLSRISPEEEKRRGVVEYLQPSYNKVGLRFLGRIFSSDEKIFYLLTNKKTLSLEDLEGQRISCPQCRGFLDALNMKMISVEHSEAFSALDRGMMDGMTLPPSVILPFGLHEVIKYAIDHPFGVDYAGVIMNMKKWDELPKHLQDILQSTLDEISVELGKINIQQELKAKEIIQKSGMQFLKLPPADAEVYLNTIYEATWDYNAEKNPDRVPELRKLLTP